MTRLWTVVVAGSLCAAGAALGQQPAVYRWAHVTYVSFETVYIDAGTEDGLRLGGRLDVMRGDSAIASLTINFIASHKAACAIVTRTGGLQVGDSARFVPVRPAEDSAAVTRYPGPASPAAGTPRARGSALRGLVGLDYLLVRPQDGAGAQLSQPAAHLRLTGTDLGGSGLSLVLDVRGRRSSRTLADGFGNASAIETRAYQANVGWRLAAPALLVTAGRQYASGIASVGLVDGVSVRADRPGWSGGGFVGAEPEPLHLGFSNAVTVAGGFLERHSRPGEAARWSLLAGLSGSYVHSATNREFLYLRGSYRQRRLSIDLTQEVDYYRPWRRVVGERAFSFTSTLAMLQYDVAPGVQITSGFDNRRNVRLYRDVINPTTLFDDSFRRGMWAGVMARLNPHAQAGIDVRTNHVSSSGTANTATLVLGADRLTSFDLFLRTRSTRYTTPARSGWLHSLTLGFAPMSRATMQLTAGRRSERDTSATANREAVNWISVDLDVSVLRSLYITASASRERGSPEAHDLLSAGLYWRF